ncbi:hypothetical protein [Nonomuraea turkmeniaca]|nr:hypothetical protein [Nonomuraea turkmeniaca]
MGGLGSKMRPETMAGITISTTITAIHNMVSVDMAASARYRR